MNTKRKILNISIVFILMCISISVRSSDKTELILEKLDAIILEMEYIQKEKEQEILLKTKEVIVNSSNIDYKYSRALYNLVNSYSLFKFDSAFYYANQLNSIAFQLQDSKTINESRVKLGLVLTTKGLFNEAIDTLNLVKPSFLNKQAKNEYYKTFIKLYFGLEYYVSDNYYGRYYKKLAIAFCDSIILNTNVYDSDFHLYSGLRNLALGKLKESMECYGKIVDNRSLNNQDLAMSNSTLGFIYKLLKNNELAKYYLAKASIYDIIGGIKENTALRSLAELLYEEGDVENAYKYIQIAMKDAEFYGTQHRILEVSNILTRIERDYLLKIDYRRKRMVKSVILIAGVTVLSLLFGVVLFIQLVNLKKARKKIIQSNLLLNELNKTLNEANVIKEEYIGYYFNKSSQFIDKIETLKKTVDRQISAKQFSMVSKTLKQLNTKNERELLFHSFDKIFLNIFPSFIIEYNKLFKTEDIAIEKNNQLSTAQRIFALIRLGITDNEKIAKILNLSVNTIYTYKTKEKNRSIVENDEFENRIFSIKSV